AVSNNLSAEHTAQFAAANARSGLICVLVVAEQSEAGKRLQELLGTQRVLSVRHSVGAMSATVVSGASGELQLKFDSDTAERAAAAVMTALSARDGSISN